MPNNKAPGHDEIEYILLKNLPKKAVVQITYIINSIIEQQKYPSEWKKSIIIPIHKTGKNKTEPTSYRPISLLPTLSKITEKIIHNRINKIEKQLKIENKNQYGFKEKHSTVHQIIRITNDIIKGFNSQKNTVMAMLDIEKAFDKVWTVGLIYKLIQQKYPGNIIKLIHSYLENRTLRVRVNNGKSNYKNIKAGVPQGSVLGPKLFNIYINDIPEMPNTKIALFADDTALYAQSYYAQAARYLIQVHLNKLIEYYSKWKIKINENKTDLIVFTKKFTNNKIITPVKINGQDIPVKNDIKYLGVTLDKRLCHHKHVTKTVQKAYGVTRNLYPILKTRSGLTENNKKLIYTTILRPIITYAAPVWCGASKTQMRKLQIYQNKILRLITNSDRYRNIDEMHRQTKIEYIEEYIEKIAQTFYKNKMDINNEMRQITNIRSHNAPNNLKHKLTYQKLPIYNEAL